MIKVHRIKDYLIKMNNKYAITIFIKNNIIMIFK
jgi:hypothetical protein